jgi:ABC-type transport system involved in multi-copper enzyme maturation permease subunit
MIWVLALTAAAIATGLFLMRRIVAAEWLKLRSHPFTLVILVAVLLGTPLLAELSLAMQEVEGYRRLSAFAVFGAGLRFGFQLTAYAVVIFGALSFASEFDRGTIKNLLVQPVTRAELFLAKCVTQLSLGAGLILLVLTESALWGCLRGELHHIWRPDVFEIYPTYDEMMGHASRMVGLLLLPLLVTSLLGIVVSTMTESSGYAVATALAVFIGLSLAGDLLGRNAQPWLFTFYPGYGLTVFGKLAVGDSGAVWSEHLFSNGWTALVPILTGALFFSAAYALFRRKDITA